MHNCKPRLPAVVVVGFPGGCYKAEATCAASKCARCSCRCYPAACTPAPLALPLTVPSRIVVSACPTRPFLACRFQLERLGYFCVDPDTTSSGSLVLNRTCTLKESSSKQTVARGGGKS